MELYSFTGVVNPFRVRMQFYDYVDIFKAKTNRDMSDVQLDVLACALYEKHFGVAFKTMDGVEFFREVNKFTKPNISKVANIVSAASAARSLKARNFWYSEPNIDLFDEAIKPESLVQLKELADVFSDNETLNNSYLIAERLGGYYNKRGYLPNSFKQFYNTEFLLENQNDEDCM